MLLVMEDHNRVTYLRKATIGTADTLFNFSDTISLFKGTILSRKPNFFFRDVLSKSFHCPNCQCRKSDATINDKCVNFHIFESIISYIEESKLRSQ